MKALAVIVAVFLVLHGLAHLLGAAVSLQLADIDGLPYKTTVLGGRWDVGAAGMAVFGVLWAVAAFGFVVAAVAWLLKITWWPPALLGVTLFSLGLTLFEWENAIAGGIINLGILAALGLWFLVMPRPPAGQSLQR